MLKAGAGSQAHENANAFWKHTQDFELPKDPLLACLILVAKFYNRSFSSRSLAAGLPLVDGYLTPQLFIRAAARAELTARIVKQDLQKVTSSLLPAVLLLNDERYGLLIEITKDKATLIYSEHGAKPETVPLAELENNYSGYSMFVRPEFHFDEQTAKVFKPRKLNWFWSVIYSWWPIYSEIIVASLFVNIFALAVPLFIMNVYDRVVPNQAIETLWVLAIGVLIAFAFDFLLRTLRAYFIDVTAKNIDVRISAAVFEQTMGLKMAAKPVSTGWYVNAVQAFESFREFITSASISIIVDLPFVLLFIFIIGYIGGPLFWIPLIAAPLVIIVGFLIQIPLTELVKRAFHFAAMKNTKLFESFTNAETIRTLCAQSPLQRKWEETICSAANINVKVRILSMLAVNISVFIQHSASILVVIGGVYMIASGNLTMGGLIACTILTGRAIAPMSQIAGLMMRYYHSVTALKALDKIMELPIERPEEKTLLYRPSIQGNMEFKNVNYLYPHQKVPALKDITLKVKNGERIALIGRIGSGKTTLCKLILGLYQPEAGSIIIDGTDINQIDPVDLRHHIGYVSQDIMLLQGSVKDNITLGTPFAEDSAILKAAQIAGVDDFVKLNPEGYDMQVGERGDRLSGGQRQAITIARTLLTNPNILVLDEPTNAMDDISERKFRDKLVTELKEKTLILATHKSSMLSIIDRLIVMEAGKILMDGPKDKVIQALKEKRVKVK